jgi:hypothetical protein
MGGESRVRRGSRPAAADPFAHVDANPEPYKIPTITMANPSTEAPVKP